MLSTTQFEFRRDEPKHRRLFRNLLPSTDDLHADHNRITVKSCYNVLPVERNNSDTKHPVVLNLVSERLRLSTFWCMLTPTLDRTIHHKLRIVRYLRLYKTCSSCSLWMHGAQRWRRELVQDLFPHQNYSPNRSRLQLSLKMLYRFLASPPEYLFTIEGEFISGSVPLL